MSDINTIDYMHAQMTQPVVRLTALETLAKYEADPLEYVPSRQVAALVRQAVAEEREACAKLAESLVRVHCFLNEDDTDHRPRELIVADCIRARGKL